MPEDLPVAQGTRAYMTVPTTAKRRKEAAGRRLAARIAQRGQVQDRPDEPAAHREQDGAAQEGAVLNQVRPDRGANVDERRADREHGADEQPDRDRDLESGVLLGEEDPGRSERMEPEKAAGRHERQRQQENARIAAALGRLPCGVAENERQAADDPEDDEVRAIVFEVGIELLTQQQRDKPHEGQREGEAPDGYDGS